MASGQSKVDRAEPQSCPRDKKDKNLKEEGATLQLAVMGLLRLHSHVQELFHTFITCQVSKLNDSAAEEG